MSTRPRRLATSALAASCLALAPSPLLAATTIDVWASPDTTAVLGGAPRADEAVVLHPFGGAIGDGGVGTLPAAAALDAYHRRPDGLHLLSVDHVMALGGSAVVYPADVVLWNGTSVVSFPLDALVMELRDGADVDAVTEDGADLLVSFTDTRQLGGVMAADEDLVRWDGAAWSLAFDGSAAGVAAKLDLDAAHRLPDGHLLLSFDGSGTVGGVAFADEDVLEHDPGAGTWELSFDGSFRDGGWAAADLDALFARTVGPLFMDGFETGDTAAWTLTIP